AGAHARQPDVRTVALDIDQLDVAAVGLHHRPDAAEDRFYLIARDHRVAPDGNPLEQHVCRANVDDLLAFTGDRQAGTAVAPPALRGNPRVPAGSSPSGFALAGLVERELLDPVADLVPVQPEQRRGLRLVAARPPQRLHHQLALER